MKRQAKKTKRQAKKRNRQAKRKGKNEGTKLDFKTFLLN